MEKFLKQISDKSKVAGYNTQKSIAFLYTTTEHLNLEITNTMSFKNHSKQNEILRYKSNKMGKVYILKITKCL